MNTDNVTNTKLDGPIKVAIKVLDKDGRLGDLAAKTGIAGGTDELRKIANSTGELAIVDRAMIGMALGF